MTDTDPAIAAAAQAIAAAEPAADRAREGVAAAESKLTEIDQRIAEREKNRAEIIDRHRAGRSEPDDAGNLALAGVDLEDYARLRTDAEAILHAARATHLAAEGELARARRDLDAAEARAAALALGQHADRLAALLREALERHAEVAGRLPAADRASLASDAAARLRALDHVLQIGLENARGVAALAQYRDRPTWRPSPALADAVRRAENSIDGRL